MLKVSAFNYGDDLFFLLLIYDIICPLMLLVFPFYMGYHCFLLLVSWYVLASFHMIYYKTNFSFALRYNRGKFVFL